MKVQPSTNLSAFFDNSQSYPSSRKENEVIEMVIEDDVAFIPKPPPMLGYRPPDIPGLILEDQLPPSPTLVSAMYEATAKLVRS